MPLSLLSLMLCVFGITTGEFVIAGITEQVADDLNVSVSSAGRLVGAYAIGMIIGGPVLTALTARFPRKPLILVLLLIGIAGNLASALAPSYIPLFVARVVTALVTSTFFAYAIVIAVSNAPADKQASTVSKLVFGMNLAMILGAPIGTFLGTDLGWRAPFLAIAAVLVLGLLLVTKTVRSVPSATPGSSAIGELKVLRDRRVQLAILATAVGNAGVLVVFTYISPLMTDVAGFGESSVAFLLLVYGVGAVVGNFIGGWLADRALLPSQVGVLVTIAGALVLMWSLATHTAPMAVMVFVLGALGYAVIPGMQARVLATATEAPTLGIAVNASGYQIAALFASWLGGVVIDDASVRALYLTAAGMTMAGVLVSSYAWYRDHTENKNAAVGDRETAPA